MFLPPGDASSDAAMMSVQRHLHHLLVLVLTSLWPCMHADFRFISYEGESLPGCSLFFREGYVPFNLRRGAFNFEQTAGWFMFFGLSPVSILGSETWLASRKMVYRPRIQRAYKLS
jgi:hypothetical protein